MTVVSVLSLLQNYAFADDDYRDHHEERRSERHNDDHRDYYEVRSKDIERFHEHDLEIWRAGHWYHGRHAGRNAWWWISGAVWYPYTQPIYPYPDPYQPPAIVIVQPVTAAALTNQPQLAQYWYYCANPSGYYPYIPECQTDWQKVPATYPPNTP